MKHTKCYIPEYPRPQFVRGDWANLNGEWKFAFGEEVTDEAALQGKMFHTICVPFTCETKLSGINDTAQHSAVWYSRTICGKQGKRAILNFEGVDYDAEVYIGGRLVGTHRGAYSRFSFDVTDYLTEEENLLAVKCTDRNLPNQVRGKQRWERKASAAGIYRRREFTNPYGWSMLMMCI